jgi:hypothetical protein
MLHSEIIAVYSYSHKIQKLQAVDRISEWNTWWNIKQTQDLREIIKKFVIIIGFEYYCCHQI